MSKVIFHDLCRLIPFSVVIYTVAGGLKATFTSSYLHTVRFLKPAVMLLFLGTANTQDAMRERLLLHVLDSGLRCENSLRNNLMVDFDRTVCVTCRSSSSLGCSGSPSR